MTTNDTAPPMREDARALQVKLYREIGISAVAAALRFTRQPDPYRRALDKPAEAPQETRTRAA